MHQEFLKDIEIARETDDSYMRTDIQRQISAASAMNEMGFFEDLIGDTNITLDQIREEVVNQMQEYELNVDESDFEFSSSCLSSPLSFILAFVLLSPEKPPSDTLRSLSKTERMVLALIKHSKEKISLNAVTKSFGVCRNTLKNRLEEKRSLEQYETNRRLLQS